MKMSVVMAAYNSEATIGRSIESFLVQDYPDRELIVVDGASKDSTLEQVRSYGSPLIRIYSEPDKGIYDAMNKGIHRIEGDAFGFLNSDDCFARKDSLSLLAEALKSADIVSGSLHFVHEHGDPAPVRVWTPTRHRPGAFRRGYGLPHPTTYARRKVVEKVGLFDISYRSAGDYDWLLRALEIEGFSHSVIDQVIVNMRLGGESTNGLKSIMRNSKETLRVRQRWLGSGAIDTALAFNLMAKIGQRLKR